ncbi:MAG: hypothetical protein KJO23_01810 [Bacteroidia bacterium]|nr:hypothetical protein [Bacteroidia bacterium]NNM22040.1 hypothetical protein [Flavobacteriaceae bacterium]
MKNFFAIAFTFVLLLTSSTSFSQMSMEPETTDYLTNKAIAIYPNANNVTGSVYENQDFVQGFIFKNGKALASNVALRYNAQKDEIEVMATKDAPLRTARVLVKSSDIYSKLMNKVFVYSNKREGLDKAGYFIVLYEGDTYALYKKLTKKFIEGRESVNSITRDVPPSYSDKEFYYLVNKVDGSFTAFPKSRKGKLNMFIRNKKAVKDFIAQNKLNINKDYALKKAVKFYDEL